MRIRSLKFRLPPLDDSGRSKGLHVSTVIKHLALSAFPARFRRNRADEAEAKHFWELGFLWEEVVGEAMARRASLSPGARRPWVLLQRELKADGMFLTPDGVDCKRWRLEEYKATLMSSAHPLTDARFWHWRVQIMAYLYVLGMTECALYVWHVVGSWRPPVPTPRAYLLKFDSYELRKNWRMILRGRDEVLRLSEGKGKAA